ncbi:MAG: TspO/MBR family protein [bacterium]
MELIPWFASILIAECVGFLGGFATAKEIPRWYARLRKPTWNPPSWVFGPMWMLLYFMMGTAAWIVWRQGGLGVWTAAYAVQLALNLAWSFIFFKAHRPGAAFAEIILLWVSIAVTTVMFWAVDPIAGVFMVPYLAWVTFAAFLNRKIWRLNLA